MARARPQSSLFTSNHHRLTVETGMPSVSDEEVVGQVKRVASVSLPSLASQPGNIDVSSQGSIALLTAETIHIFVSIL
jgi:hypothetical protein